MLRATSHDCNLGERHTNGMSGMAMCVCEQKGKKQQLAGHSTLADKAMKHSGSGSSSRPHLCPLPAVPPATATTTTRTRPLPGPTESTENAKLWH